MGQGQACWSRDNEGKGIVRQHRLGENKMHHL